MWKILCKNIVALYRYRDFRVGIFYFASPCIRYGSASGSNAHEKQPTNIIHCVHKKKQSQRIFRIILQGGPNEIKRGQLTFLFVTSERINSTVAVHRVFY